MARNLLAVDLSYQSYRASAANSRLTYDGVFTGGLYGFFQILGKMVRDCNATRLIICTDSKPYKRSEEFPEYKAFRKANGNEELRERHMTTMGLLREVLPELGVPLWGVPGFESDDLIGHLVHKYRHRYDRIVAGSNDSDLYQLMELSPNFHVFADEWSKAMNAERLLAKTGLTPSQYMLSTALSGTHNDLPGIPGIGPARAISAVKDEGKLRTLRSQHSAIIDRNLRLIALPHPDFPWDAGIPSMAADFDPRHFYRVLRRYGIDATAPMVAAFESVLT